MLQALRQHAHHLERDRGEVGDHAVEEILGDLQGYQRLGRLDGRGARHVAQDADLADEGIAADLGHLQRAVRCVDQDVGGAGEHDIGGIRLVALMEQRLARLVLRALRREGQQLQLGRLDLGKERRSPQRFHVFLNTHPVLVLSSTYSAAAATVPAISRNRLPSRSNSRTPPCSTTRPSFITTILSNIRAKATLSVTSTKPPPAIILRNRSVKRRWVWSSNTASALFRTSRRGCLISARTSAPFW